MSKAQPKYRAIFFDFDGTAIPNAADGMPSQRLIDTARRYHDRIHLIAATGRPIRYAAPIIDTLGLTDPCIISGGTILIDPVTRHIIRRTLIPETTVHAMMKILKTYPYDVHFSEHGDSNELPAGHSNYADVDIAFLAPVTEAEVATMRPQIEALPGITFNTAPSWGPSGYVVHITPSSATKEHAVGEILARLGIPREQAIGVGDGDNDLHLFAAVGLKVAMGNAGPRLKAAADIIAPSVDDDGLAEIIERYAA